MPRYGAHACRRLRYKDTGGFAETFRHFDEVVGFSYLKGYALERF